DFGLNVHQRTIDIMTKSELLLRVKRFSLNIILMVEAIPQTVSGKAIANQVVRSGTSVGANYRSACRAKSDRDFLNKMVIIEEEADETSFWLEMLIESGTLDNDLTPALLKESDELTAIFTASGKTVRQRLNKP